MHEEVPAATFTETELLADYRKQIINICMLDRLARRVNMILFKAYSLIELEPTRRLF